MPDIVTIPKNYLKKIDAICDFIAALKTEEWVTEKALMVRYGLSADVLQKIKTTHPQCFRYRPSPKGCDTLGRTIRRGIMYNVAEIEKIYKKVV